MTRRGHRAREQLREAAIALSEEIWAGKWQHVPDLKFKPIAEWTEILQELARRAPGHSEEAYEDALLRHHMLRR